MLALALFVAAVGIAVGLLGGGGSILLVPVFVYVAGLPIAQALALSLLIVGVISVSALPAHARAGHVDWRAGLLLGGGGMAGAFGGARVSMSLPEPVLLGAFAVLMLATALRMLRKPVCSPDEAVPRRARASVMLPLGATIGFVSGLLGAGGGFLIVPALVLLAGLPMRTAIGTSLLVLALQSSVGFITHALDTEMSIATAAVASIAASLGSSIGARLSRRVDPLALRRGFAWLALLTGVALLWQQLPHVPWRLWLSATWKPLAGGAIIGLAAALLWLMHGRIAGISGISGGLLAAQRGDRGWRAWFVTGLIAGGLGLTRIWPGAIGASPAPLGTAVLAGALVGVGTTLANGCTSGHGVCGTSRLSKRSLAATLTFMVAGVATVFASHHLL